LKDCRKHLQESFEKNKTDDINEFTKKCGKLSRRIAKFTKKVQKYAKKADNAPNTKKLAIKKAKEQKKKDKKQIKKSNLNFSLPRCASDAREFSMEQRRNERDSRLEEARGRYGVISGRDIKRYV
jgi:hypothetical protein